MFNAIYHPCYDIQLACMMLRHSSCMTSPDQTCMIAWYLIMHDDMTSNIHDVMKSIIHDIITSWMMSWNLSLMMFHDDTWCAGLHSIYLTIMLHGIMTFILPDVMTSIMHDAQCDNIYHSWCFAIMKLQPHGWSHDINHLWFHNIYHAWCLDIQLTWHHGIYHSWCSDIYLHDVTTSIMMSLCHYIYHAWCHAIYHAWCHIMYSDPLWCFSIPQVFIDSPKK